MASSTPETRTDPVKDENEVANAVIQPTTTTANSAVRSELERGGSVASSKTDSDPRNATLLDEKRAPTPPGTHPAESPLVDEQKEAMTSEKQVASGSEDEKKNEVSTDQDGPEDHAAHHVHGIARIILVFGLCATTFIIGLDQMIIATAIPKITTLFGSLEEYVAS